MDERYKVAISRLGNRVRVAGSAELGGAPTRSTTRARSTTLYKVLERLVSRRGAHEPGAALERRAADAARRPAGARRQRHRRRLAQPRPRLQRLGAGLRLGACRWPMRWPGATPPIEPRRPGRSSACADTLERSMRTHRHPRTADLPLHRRRAARGASRPQALAGAAGPRADAPRRRGRGTAGAGAARRMRERVRVVAGPGNNGGDGLEAAIHLQQLGKQVEVTLRGRARRADDARDALARARAAGVVDRSAGSRRRWTRSDLAIDALLGIGATRARRRRAARRRSRAQRPALPGAGGRPALGPGRRHRPAARRSLRARRRTR